MIKRSSLTLIAIFILTAAAFYGCAHTGDPLKASTEQLTRRVNSYWEWKIKDQPEKTYPMELPEARKKVDILRYARTTYQQQHQGAQILSFKVLSLDIKQDKAVAFVRQEIGITTPTAKTRVNVVREDKWYKIDGEWYHEFEDPRSLVDIISNTLQKREKPRSK